MKTTNTTAPTTLKPETVEAVKAAFVGCVGSLEAFGQENECGDGEGEMGWNVEFQGNSLRVQVWVQMESKTYTRYWTKYGMDGGYDLAEGEDWQLFPINEDGDKIYVEYEKGCVYALEEIEWSDAISDLAHNAYYEAKHRAE